MRYTVVIFMLFLVAFDVCAVPKIIVPEKQKRGLAFSVGVRGKYVILHPTLITKIIHCYRSSYFLSSTPGALFANNYWAAVANDYRVTMLTGVSRTGYHDNPTQTQYLTTLFGADTGTKAFVEPSDYQALSSSLDTPNLSGFSLDFTAGAVYTIDQYLGVFFRGMYAFGMNNGSEKGIIKKEFYDLKNNAVKGYTTVDGASTIQSDLLALTFEPFSGNVARNAVLDLAINEGFSVLLGVRLTPAPHCTLDVACGVRRYVVQCTWKEAEHAYPYPSTLLLQNYVEGGAGDFWVPHKQPVIAEEVLWPLLIQVEASYVSESGMHHITVGFEYASFDAALTEKNPPDIKTSQPQKESAECVRTQVYPATMPGYGQLRDQVDAHTWGMSIVPSMEVKYQAHVTARSIAFSLGYSFQL